MAATYDTSTMIDESSGSSDESYSYQTLLALLSLFSFKYEPIDYRGTKFRERWMILIKVLIFGGNIRGRNQ